MEVWRSSHLVLWLNLMKSMLYWLEVVTRDVAIVGMAGRVVEHNSPAVLIQDQSSFFSKLVMEYSM